MKQKIKYPISVAEAKEIVKKGIFNLHPATIIEYSLKFLGWSQVKYSLILGKPKNYINNRFNNGFSRRFTNDDLIILKNTLKVHVPEINFNELVIDVLLSRGRLAMSPIALIKRHEKEIIEKDEIIHKLENQIYELKQKQH